MQSRSAFFVASQIKTFVPFIYDFVEKILARLSGLSPTLPYGVRCVRRRGAPILCFTTLRSPIPGQPWILSLLLLFTPDEMLDRAWGIREKARLKLERHRGGKYAEQVWQVPVLPSHRHLAVVGAYSPE